MQRFAQALAQATKSLIPCVREKTRRQPGYFASENATRMRSISLGSVSNMPSIISYLGYA